MRRPTALVLGLFATVGFAAPAAAAQTRYMLQLKPKVGDTLRMEMEEERSATGTTKVGRADSTRTMSSRLRMVSRAIVQAQDQGAVTILAVIDSVSLSTTDKHGFPTPTGQRMVFRLSHDGTMRIVDERTGLDRGVAELVALMPAALPGHAVAVGESWTRSLPMVVGRSGGHGVVYASFKLDSMSGDGHLAYLSMRGELRRDSLPAGPPRGSRMAVSGTVTGALLLDRRRGWLMESRFAVVLHTTMMPTQSTTGAAPVRFLTRISQRMRTLDRK